MKITLDRTDDDIHIQVERDPMPPERFTALCRLAGDAIGGIVLLGAVRMVGAWVFPWAVGALVAVGLYKIIQSF